ncbi:hypothetical protein HPDFL43_00540 [Hoeflea phototrophica DFL-43]|uniref:Uncharacterized protein n=1 Tax=Hoeflea phototrophica (strain DSM 17068 / NCIMB 14078 / DFL-43) TaxID=411684 RepID=A9CYU2_HOEPD|nr:hypothetical protein [Hoeflea phototrophica]EDQ34639.2 hypothetical protein HPDFL43_00540 [Hoeflea phototrophica DFL-43]
MAPWLKFLIPFASALAGLAVWVALGGLWGVALFIIFFLSGSIAGAIIFKRIATPKQIREDLEARLKND